MIAWAGGSSESAYRSFFFRSSVISASLPAPIMLLTAGNTPICSLSQRRYHVRRIDLVLTFMDFVLFWSLKSDFKSHSKRAAGRCMSKSLPGLPRKFHGDLQPSLSSTRV